MSRDMRTIALCLFTAGALLTSASTAASDRTQFIRECLDAAPSPDTSKFNDYAAGSYHVGKLDLLEGLQTANLSQPERLRAVIIFGPSGPLWAYYIFVCLAEGDAVRVNFVVMPHARITAKGSCLVSDAEFVSFTKKFLDFGLLTKEMPVARQANDPASLEWSFDFLMATWTDGKRELHFSSIEQLAPPAGTDAKQREAFFEHFNTLSKRIEFTYPPKDTGPRANPKK